MICCERRAVGALELRASALAIARTLRLARPSSPVAGEAWSRTGAEHTPVFEHRKRRPNGASGRDRRASLLKIPGMGGSVAKGNVRIRTIVRRSKPPRGDARNPRAGRAEHSPVVPRRTAFPNEKTVSKVVGRHALMPSIQNRLPLVSR